MGRAPTLFLAPWVGLWRPVGCLLSPLGASELGGEMGGTGGVSMAARCIQKCPAACARGLLSPSAGARPSRPASSQSARTAKQAQSETAPAPLDGTRAVLFRHGGVHWRHQWSPLSITSPCHGSVAGEAMQPGRSKRRGEHSSSGTGRSLTGALADGRLLNYSARTGPLTFCLLRASVLCTLPLSQLHCTALHRPPNPFPFAGPAAAAAASSFRQHHRAPPVSRCIPSWTWAIASPVPPPPSSVCVGARR